MNRESSQRQRPLFYDGPAWQQLDEQLQRQLVGRLADLCYVIASTLDQSSPNEQEQHDDKRHN